MFENIKIQCKHCDKTFESSSVAKIHYEKYHSNLPKYTSKNMIKWKPKVNGHFASLYKDKLKNKEASINNFPKIEFNIIVVDYNSKKSDLDKIQAQLDNSNVKNSLISLDIN